MKEVLYILSGIFLFTNVQGQSIKGTVSAVNNNGIDGATITILNAGKSTSSDRAGDFKFAGILPGTYQLSVSAIGFATKIIGAKVVAGQVTELHITLTEQNRQLSEAVVTANKREEDIIKVATSITSLSAKKIEDNRVWGLGDLAAIVPNYAYQELGVAYQQIQSIRGIQAFSENPAVSTYIDDVNNLDILANGAALTDVERIEVLRGPQGTLFGRNAMGGVVNIITKKPTNNATGFVEAGAGNLALQRFSAGIKTPIVKDKLFFGFTGLYQSKNGFYVNDTTGTGATDGSINGKRLGDVKNIYGNLFLKWLPTSRLMFTLNIKGQRDWSNNSTYMVSQFNDSVGFADPNKLNLGRIGQDQRNIFNNSLVVKYSASSFTITSISAYQNIRMGYKDIYFPGYYSSFYDKKPGELLPPQVVYSEEVRINSNSDTKLQYTAGIYGFSQKSHGGDNVYELSAADAATYGYPDGSYIIARNDGKNYGLAGFGEVSYQLTDKLKATVGLRYDYENRQSTFNGFGDAILMNGEVTNYVPDTTAKGTYSAFSPKFVLSYAVNSHSNVYASYNRGFRAGGINAQRFTTSTNAKQTFDPEYSDNFEIGYKTNLAQNKVSIAASAFLIKWKDMQMSNIVAPFTYALENVGNSRSMGLELEISAIPVNGLQLDGSVGLNKTKYEDFDLVRVDYATGIETKTPIAGNSLSNTPSHTIYLAAQYEFGLTKKMRAVIHGDVRNIGTYYSDMQNTIKQPTYTLLNTRVGLNYDNYGLFFWGQNLSNERYLLYGNGDNSFGRNVIMSGPRTYGVTLSARF
ncbi:TonB-dependent receptor [Chitinophaga sancti]|uniref:TonB-dependent receptor n=1 Tax=Chitinophaga sancti TaxID=1004 RepID=UPI002A762A85|nr:TonB-dependent receptor [Chitinophaga sancti]WPQ60670.1 TonB-dependent receptor [Chitinophaga sancti]